MIRTISQPRWQRRWLPLLIVLLLSSWLLMACERTLPRPDDPAEDPPPVAQLPPETEQEDTPPPVEEEVDSPIGYPEPEPEVSPEPETEEVADTPREEDEAEPAEEDPAEEAEVVEAQPPETEMAATPSVHTVARGENLYRIGLQYGVSWLRLAQFNNISNPNRITVGQQIRIPGPGDPVPQPTPSPHTETTYIVRAGDNLYRIGRIYGISWVQIAEANGLVNPNQIFVGQELKIPVEASGPAPQFTHQVQAGETLFRISLRYGVPWPAIAEANGLESPYVIYVGQTLVIPGG